jgi:hypothetical protein
LGRERYAASQGGEALRKRGERKIRPRRLLLHWLSGGGLGEGYICRIEKSEDG